MSNDWYARPVLYVRDIDKSVDFYVKQFGFTINWRYEEEGTAWVAQVARPGCELILTRSDRHDGDVSQKPDKAGKGLMFISLDPPALDALRAELEGHGVDVKEGQWGYSLMVIVDPDGNEFYFPHEGIQAKGTLQTFK
jgi:catechol 2,3-dioxygenase-like lactoylglutathione lyase family enzyme